MDCIAILATALLFVCSHALPAEKDRSCCLSAGETCLNFATGAFGECCDGSLCSDYVSGIGYACSSADPTESETTTTTTTVGTCLATGATCLSLANGVLGECCDGSLCSDYVSGVGFACSSFDRTESETTTTTITVGTCLATGATCLSFATGAVGECCDGSLCSDYVSGVGFACSSFDRTESETTTTTTTTGTCLATGATCLSFATGAIGDCCDGSSLCSEFLPGIGFACASPAPAPRMSTCLSSGSQCLSFVEGILGDCCEGSTCSIFVSGAGYSCS